MRAKKEQRGSASVEFVLTIPAIVALSSALLGVLLLCVKGFWVADVSHRYARSSEVYSLEDLEGTTYSKDREVVFCAETSLPRLVRKMTGDKLCHSSKFIKALPETYSMSAEEKSDSPYKCRYLGGDSCL